MTDQPTKSAHTPGPWSADGLTIYAPNGYRVCRLTEPHKNERGKERAEGNEYRAANARLIAAAPDLLAACIALSKRMPKRGEVYRSGIGGSGALTHYDPEVEDMFAAIAKATGTPIRATDSEIKEELRNEIQASGDC